MKTPTTKRTPGEHGIDLDEVSSRIREALAAMHAAQDEAAIHREARDRAKIEAKAIRRQIRALERSIKRGAR